MIESEAYFRRPIEELFSTLKTSAKGLSSEEASQRIQKHGRNVFPTKKPSSIGIIFFHQFLNPLIYILLAAALLSIFLEDYKDAIFIALVLIVNAIVGTIQEHGAEKSARALREMSSLHAIVLRDQETRDIESEFLVPGDVVFLESGKKVPADLRLLESNALEVDESLLTGESLPVFKDANLTIESNVALGDRKNMCFMGSFITKGRGKGLVVSTALSTELGKIADSLVLEVSAKPPLLIRMEKFTKKIAVILLFITSMIAFYLLAFKNQPWSDVVMFSVALAVSAIPEGLPVAVTVALAIASRKMAKRNVIVRKLPAVESLGSCTFIATDKTGTLTVNQLTIKKIGLPRDVWVSVSGTGRIPNGKIESSVNESQRMSEGLDRLIYAGVLCNEADLRKKNGDWIEQGDAVDLAFLSLAYKAEINPIHLRSSFSLLETIPFEPENQYAASLHQSVEGYVLSVKGAFEKIVPFCDLMMTSKGEVKIDPAWIYAQGDQLAEEGYRVLALAGRKSDERSKDNLKSQLQGLTFFGLVGMIDPLRAEAKEAVQKCRSAGIRVAMVTGDHPKTALAIARELNLAENMNDVVSGSALKAAVSDETKANWIGSGQVFARVEPNQKLEIVQALLHRGEFVAVTGDGANDAPALKAANVGIAMGKSGTDVAKETADLIIADDRFETIVAGVEEGRIAYNNIRKVVYLLISTGAAEILMFCLSLLFGTPLPLTAVQLLWLNLVTNGIQDVGLAFEPGVGDELHQKPRKPNEPIFDRLMIERVIISSLVMGGMSFWQFYAWIESGAELAHARNMTLLLMVLFENVMIGNCRSETRSAFTLNPLRNPVLLYGTIGAQLIHILAMYTPGLKEILGVSPVGFLQWVQLLSEALTVLIVIEIYKLFRSRFKKFQVA